jgi:uncharacterized protein YbjT (DUF2867 family)
MRIAVAGGTGTVGRHVVDIARTRGHDVVVLTRSTGVDLTTGSGLAPALGGVDVVVDAASVSTQSARASKAFFGAVTTTLLAAEEEAGVGHHIALSIVGSAPAPFGYYAGKALQERLVSDGRVPWTILRATQFHEFARQLYGQVKLGPIILVPTMFSQPVAAREVGERLVDLAEGTPSGHATDLAGPEQLRMIDTVRAYAAATRGRAPILEVPLPGGFGKALRDGTITAGPGADRGTQTYAEWIETLSGS